MDALELIQMQIRLEYRVDAQGCMATYPGSSEQAYYIVYQHSCGYQPFLSLELPVELQQKLLAIGPGVAFEQPEKITKLISDVRGPCKGGEEIFWSGYFARIHAEGDHPLASRDGEKWVIFRDGQVVSQAMSVREDEHCAEVYVETLPAYRGRGYGRQVVAAWAWDIMRGGRAAFYSYKMTNSASAALACSLGVEWYANVVSFEAVGTQEPSRKDRERLDGLVLAGE